MALFGKDAGTSPHRARPGRSRKSSGVQGFITFAVVVAALCGVVALLGNGNLGQGVTVIRDAVVSRAGSQSDQDYANPLNPRDLPAYGSAPWVEVGDNQPDFTQAQKAQTTSFEVYGPLDKLGRCTGAFALLGEDLMPTQKRGDISKIKPTGWHQNFYNFVDGEALYNRCHLIAHSLAGEDANERNLITGTRYLNTQGMLDFEEGIHDYILDTGNHVLYRVTPIFEGANLLASGVRLEGWSVEDGGEGICFDVYCYNVQPGVTIDYATGENHLA